MRKIALAALMVAAAGALNGQTNDAGQKITDCSTISSDMQLFANGLSPSNKAIFCTKFNDAMRMQAMQMAGQKEATGKMAFTPDQSVEKVATDNNMMMQKSTGGCPVK